jgi:hypothetical protein
MTTRVTNEVRHRRGHKQVVVVVASKAQEGARSELTCTLGPPSLTPQAFVAACLFFLCWLLLARSAQQTARCNRTLGVLCV